jgi:hypothetical protein
LVRVTDLIEDQKVLGLVVKEGSLRGTVRVLNPTGRSLEAEDVFRECALGWPCTERRGVIPTSLL